MNNIFALIRNTFITNMRNRIFLILIIFGMIAVGSSVLLGLLGQEEGIRVFSDLGLAAIEILALLTSVYLMTRLVLEEMESKTIYLVLTRSVSKMEYLLGRYLGSAASVLACMLLMTAFHLLLLWLKGWKFHDYGFMYLMSVLMSYEKILLISSVALLFSLFSSSEVTAVVFTAFVWILGHFAMELKFLSAEIQSEPLKWIFKGIYYMIPHFQYMNARDLWLTVSNQMPLFLLKGTVFTALYSGACLILSLIVFKKKEF